MAMKYKKDEAIRIYERLQRQRRIRQDLSLAQLQLLVLDGTITTVDGVWSSAMVDSESYFTIGNWTAAGTNTIQITDQGAMRVDRPVGGNSNGASINVQTNAALSICLSPDLLISGRTYIWEGIFETNDNNAQVNVRDSGSATNNYSTINSGLKRIEFTYGGTSVIQRFRLVSNNTYAAVSKVSIFEA